jgi:hypothetical protein
MKKIVFDLYRKPTDRNKDDCRTALATPGLFIITQQVILNASNSLFTIVLGSTLALHSWPYCYLIYTVEHGSVVLRNCLIQHKSKIYTRTFLEEYLFPFNLTSRYGQNPNTNNP